MPAWGWSVVNNVPGGPSWGDIASCGPNGNGGNWTNGLGDAACMSASTLEAGAYDAELRTPVFSLVGYSNSTFSFLMNYQNWAGIDRLDFDISTDGGATWAPLRTYTTDQGAFQSTPGVYITTDLAPYLGQSNLMLRWRYHWDTPERTGLVCADRRGRVQVRPDPADRGDAGQPERNPGRGRWQPVAAGPAGRGEPGLGCGLRAAPPPGLTTFRRPLGFPKTPRVL